MRFRADASAAERAAALRTVGGVIDSEVGGLGVWRVLLPDTGDELRPGFPPAAILAAHPAVEFAEADAPVRLAFDPDDEFYESHPSVSEGQWGIRIALVDRAWDTVRGSADVRVAILDTGVDPAHPDLEDALGPGNTFVSRPSADCDEDSERDDNSHGTHVAGIIGATGDNGEGIAGVAFGVTLMAVKVLDCTGQGSLSDVAEGLVWAVDEGARVVNLSLGSVSDSPTLRSAIGYATEHDVLVVTASGNCGTTRERCMNLNQLEYPAAYEEVLAVGATDTDDSVAFFSTRNETVDVAAPGRRILSTTPTYPTFLSDRDEAPAALSYSVFSGTSQAAPFVAGLAALVLSAEPELTSAELRERIRSTADDLGAAGRDDSYGDGRVNALRAVGAGEEEFGVVYDLAALPTSALTGGSFDTQVTVTNASSFDWQTSGDDAVHLEWSWLDAAGQPVAGQSGVMRLRAGIEVGGSATLSGTITAPALPGDFTLRLDLVRGGTTPFSERGADPATLAVVVGTGVGATYAPSVTTASFDAGATQEISVVVTNSGTVTWLAGGPNPVRLSYHWLKDGAVVAWDGQRAVLPGDVPTGGSVTLTLPVMPPEQAGTYTLRLDLVQEGIAWFTAFGVAGFDLEASVRSAFVAAYEVSTPPVLLPGGRAAVAVTVTNTGSVDWPAGGEVPVRLAAHVSDASGATVVWDGIRTVLAADLAPGAELSAQVVVDAPLAPGSYRVRVDVVREGVAWLSDLGVATGEADLLVAADYRAELPTGPLTVSRADPAVDVTVKNLGIATWTLAVASPIAVSAHWYDAAENVLVWDGPRTLLTVEVPPGATVPVRVDLGPPPEGAAFVTIDLVSEGLRWFGAGLRRPVTVVP